MQRKHCDIDVQTSQSNPKVRIADLDINASNMFMISNKVPSLDFENLYDRTTDDRQLSISIPDHP